MLDDCRECGSGDWRAKIAEGFSVGIPRLANLCQVAISYRCACCGATSPQRSTVPFSGGPPFGAEKLPPGPTRSAVSGVEHASLFRAAPGSRTGLSYSGVRSQDGWEVVPVFEPAIRAGALIDRHGDPDLMADFSEEYLDQFWKLLPSGRLPDSVPAIMPALLLLVTSAELAIKAFHIRSGGSQPPVHSLPGLYSSLDAEHREEAQRRFAASPVAAKLSEAGAEPPAVEGILGQYAATLERCDSARWRDLKRMPARRSQSRPSTKAGRRNGTALGFAVPTLPGFPISPMG